MLKLYRYGLDPDPNLGLDPNLDPNPATEL